MARKNENDCLDLLKNALLGKTNTSVYCNCDLKKVTKYIFSAKPNKDENSFPDFVFDDGGIEHFQVTSSKERNKKGSEFNIKEAKNKQVRKQFEEKLEKSIQSSKADFDTISINNFDEKYSDFSYERFILSLKRNVSNHIESLIKSSYKNKCIMFLIEQQTARLFIENSGKTISFYELHKDRNVLLFLKDICQFVRYIIYFVHDSIEIIELSKIDSLLEKALEYKNVKGGSLIKGHLYLSFNLKI